MAVVTMKQLLEAGMHFGHQTRRWNPKMKRFIFGERNGIYIIDLNQTLGRIDTAYSFVRDLVAGGGSVLFVGTKKQTQDAIASAAQRVGMPYVNERWLGGMLTNFQTISGRVKKMAEYERMKESGDFEAMPKKEALILGRELEKLQRNLGGIRNLTRLPEAIFVIDTKKEHIAVTEANKLGMPIVAVVDTNCDPDLIQYIVPGNDDAIRAGTLMCRIIADAVEEGRMIASRRNAKAAAAAPAPTVDPEAEARRVHHQAEARRQAALQAQEREARLATSRRPQAADAPASDSPAPDSPAPDSPAPDSPAPDSPAPDSPAPDSHDAAAHDAAPGVTDAQTAETPSADAPPPGGPPSSPPVAGGTVSGSPTEADTASGPPAGDTGAGQQPAAPADAVEDQRPAAADPSMPPAPPVAAEAATSTPDAPTAAPAAPAQPSPGEG